MKAIAGIVFTLNLLSQAPVAPSVICRSWTSTVDPSVDGPEPNKSIEKLTNEEKIQAIACLMTLKGQKGKARFGGATRLDVSQMVPECSVEVGALFYIGYIYYGRWDYCEGIALISEKSGWNSPGDIAKAWGSYEKWFSEVKKIGIDAALARHLDPLAYTPGVHWY